MKRAGILNAELASRCAALGHTDLVAVVDCGFPIEHGVPTVDLALVHGIPPLPDTLAALLDELVVEAHTYASESEGTKSGAMLVAESHRLGTPQAVSHEYLKSMVARCALVVRTGEATPHANVILRCGVAFGQS